MPRCGRAPGELSARLSDNNQEHCTVYNMNRLASYLLRWTGDPEYADYRERNLYNGILAQQHPATGMVTYYLPLHAGGRKTWSTPTESFWCCVATLVQAHAGHADDVYYTDDDGRRRRAVRAERSSTGQRRHASRQTASSRDPATPARPTTARCGRCAGPTRW